MQKEIMTVSVFLKPALRAGGIRRDGGWRRQSSWRSKPCNLGSMLTGKRGCLTFSHTESTRTKSGMSWRRPVRIDLAEKDHGLQWAALLAAVPPGHLCP